MRTLNLRPWAGAVLLALAGWAAAGQDDAAGLTVKDRTITHAASKSTFTVPDGWLLEPKPETVGGTSILSVRKGPPKGFPGPVTEVTITWSKLQLERDDTLAQETTVLNQLYPQKVAKEEPFNLNEKPGFRIAIDDGPAHNGKENGVVYLFAEGTNGYKIKARAFFPKDQKDASVKDIEAMLPNLKWQ